MTPTAHASGIDSSCRSHDQEARLLVELLRTSPLVLLYAEAGADKTALLRLGLVPLLGRRAGEKLVAAAVRASGVVVPFPDRRSRSSVRTPKRRREVVVYFDDWTDLPLTALRQALHLATATGTAEQLAPSMRLSELLAELCDRLDAHIVVLLDRFEDFVQAPSPGAGSSQFSVELAEAINSARLPASFLIAVSDAARPRLENLRGRIPGFDDFSLKLMAPRDFKAPAPPRIVKPASPTKPAAPVAIQSLPVLNETLARPTAVSQALDATAAQSIASVPRQPKVKGPPRPRIQVRTEDVYAMIAEALERITARALIEAALPPVPGRIAPNDSDPSPPPAPGRPATRSGGKDLLRAIERMEQRMGAKPESRRDS